MTVQEFATTLKEKEIDNVVGYWMKCDSKKLALFDALVRLGDSRALSCATVMMDQREPSDIYQQAVEA